VWKHLFAFLLIEDSASPVPALCAARSLASRSAFRNNRNHRISNGFHQNNGLCHTFTRMNPGSRYPITKVFAASTFLTLSIRAPKFKAVETPLRRYACQILDVTHTPSPLSHRSNVVNWVLVDNQPARFWPLHRNTVPTVTKLLTPGPLLIAENYLTLPHYLRNPRSGR